MTPRTVTVRNRINGAVKTTEYNAVKKSLIPNKLSLQDWDTQVKKWPAQLIAQNSKLAKTDFWQWTIPALEAAISSTEPKIICPAAGECAAFCYAQQGGYIFRQSQVAHTQKLNAYLTEPVKWQAQIIAEIRAKQKANKIRAFRIHDSGDFFDLTYFQQWCAIANAIPTLQFYAYTKMVPLVKPRLAEIPRNLSIIYSYGGKFDELIDPEQDRHSRVFDTHVQMEKEGYADTTTVDSNAACPEILRIGLVYHGNKAFAPS